MATSLTRPEVDEADKQSPCSPAVDTLWYIDHIDVVTTSMAAVYASGEYAPLMPLFERVLSAPASSAPVDRVFSESGLISNKSVSIFILVCPEISYFLQPTSRKKNVV